jgi:transcriptional regulator
VQAYGKVTLFFEADERTDAFLSRQVRDLSDHEEKSMGHEKPWQVDDAPSRYIDLLKRAIIGIEIKLHRLEGKFKMSQEMGPDDRQGVIEGFSNLGTDKGQSMAKLVEERSLKRETTKN